MNKSYTVYTDLISYRKLLEEMEELEKDTAVLKKGLRDLDREIRNKKRRQWISGVRKRR